MSADTSSGGSGRQAASSAAGGRSAADSGPRVADRWIALAVLNLAQLMIVLETTTGGAPACAELGTS
jgi:hypothetical protein